MPVQRSTRASVVGLIVAALVALSVGCGSSTTDAQPEVFLEGLDALGDNPFVSHIPTGVELPATIAPPAVPASAGTTTVVTGEEPGLYGAIPNADNTVRDELASYYADDPAAADAFAEALDADDGFSWRSGTLSGSDVEAFVRELTPVVLRFDTRVTDHGLLDAHAAARQAILEAGTVVLVDAFGMPRLRALSGSPLARAAELPDSPAFRGTPWSGFAASNVIVCAPASGALAVLKLIDLATGATIEHDLNTMEPQKTTTTTTSTTPPRTTTPVDTSIDVSGVWVLESAADNFATGTLTETSGGYHFDTPATNEHTASSCDLTVVDSSATLACTHGETALGSTYSTQCTYTGTVSTTSARKFRFDGTLATAGCGPSGMPMVLRPQ